MIQIADTIGAGAKVLRTFSFGGRQLRSGETLTPEEVGSIPMGNLRALIDNHQLSLKTTEEGPKERFLMSTGDKGKYNVIEGRLLNTEPLSREEAAKLIRSQ